jgi:hypothetical protein
MGAAADGRGRGFRCLRNRGWPPAVARYHHPITRSAAETAACAPIAFVINSCLAACTPSAGADGVQTSTFRAETRTRISVTRPLGVFGAVGTGESLAATGRIREQSPGRRAGPARRYTFAYMVPHRV